MGDLLLDKRVGLRPHAIRSLEVNFIIYLTYDQ